jgi:hypothetical protein
MVRCEKPMAYAERIEEMAAKDDVVGFPPYSGQGAEN